ncbi:pentapeptide repeat-containing protein [Niabella hibiscisoli]|uniref:pentapeptide repeat-containing protein n=1 Tax=Niabella hibiscisoli TaxID=1825928 RepID=UPI001F0F2C72|nr:pentapeptide repeat-containing protein [Niabella hibiscisoli]MCH5716006.1 pentapeptide repeat-containing protein [Niabella hibiscisoli]
MEKYFVDATYENIDYTTLSLPLGEYEGCTFHNCNFSNSNLCKISFIDCVFNHCNISNAQLSEAIIRDVQFNHCKMIGLHFETCSDFLFPRPSPNVPSIFLLFIN